VRIPDRNLLLYAVDREAPDHATASRRWNATLSGRESVGLAWTVLLGFIRLTTNARVVRSPLSPEAAWTTWIDGSGSSPSPRWWTRRDAMPRVLRDLLGRTGTGGNLVSDAHLAALAIEHGAEFCSADRDLGRFPGLRWSNPLAG
jgi:uncharacterized protein